jgi:hypothetical protein
MNSADNTAISRQQVQLNVNNYSELLKAAGKFHKRITEVAQAGFEFAAALELMSKCKGAEGSGADGLKAAAEFHRTIAKSQEQLSDSFHKEFEIPLNRNLSSHVKRVEENEKQFEKNMRKVQEDITKTEGKMLKGRKKDLAQFQQALNDMQKQAAEAEQIRQENSDKVLKDEQKNIMFVVQKAAGIIKYEYEHFNLLALSSRELTEDLIGMAFAPPGKALDGEEKKRLVDKFLGSNDVRPSTVVEISTELPSPDRKESTYSVNSPLAPSATLSIQTAQPTMKAPAPPAASTVRPVSPPVTPTNMVGPSSLKLNSSIQESLKKLNIAAAQVIENDYHTESPKSVDKDMDVVFAIHDFTARTERELSFKKNDELIVKQRQDNWLYSYRINFPEKCGWVPLSYTSKYAE